MDLTPQLIEFEQKRLALFTSCAFEGESRWVIGPARAHSAGVGAGLAPRQFIDA